MKLEKAFDVAHATEWRGDCRVNFMTAIKAAKVLAKEVQRLQDEKIAATYHKE